MLRLSLSLLVGVLLLNAEVIRVPSEQPDVQSGLNAANAGDTVLVADGTYNERIVWPGADGICLLSENGSESTVINAGGDGRVIVFSGGYTRATRIEGFEISGGKSNSGAGILVNSGSPTLTGNVIRNNLCRGGRDYGGGIFCGYGTAPLVQGNLIEDNTCADTSTWNHGGGIYVDMASRAEIRDNRITGNTCSGGYWNYGAGVYCDLQSHPLIAGNVIDHNVCTLGDRGYGAGVYVSIQSDAAVVGNLVIDNTCSCGLWNYGAGISCQAPGIIAHNTIAGNTCEGGNWRYGGGIEIDSQALILNNIVVLNRAGQGGGIYNARGTVYRLSHNDVWNNTGGNYYGCPAGPGDISQDPFFASGAHGDYYLSQLAAGQPQMSPCVDTGATGVLPESLETWILARTTRTDSVADALPSDLGYHYPREAPLVGVAAPLPVAPAPIVQAFPNPFTDRVIFYSPRGSMALSIYDAGGRLVHSRRFPESRDLTWDAATVPAGTYFYRLTGNPRPASGRLVKLQP